MNFFLKAPLFLKQMTQKYWKQEINSKSFMKNIKQKQKRRGRLLRKQAVSLSLVQKDTNQDEQTISYADEADVKAILVSQDFIFPWKMTLCVFSAHKDLRVLLMQWVLKKTKQLNRRCLPMQQKMPRNMLKAKTSR